MNPRPTVSVISSVFNEGNTIYNLIQDILHQHESNFTLREVLVLSDGSTDNTVAEVKKIQDPRVHVVDNKEQIGQNHRFNAGYPLCCGDIIITIDGDVRIKDRFVFESLVRRHLHTKVPVVAGHSEPRPLKNFIQKITHFGFRTDSVVKNKLTGAAIRYRLIGRLFSCTKESLKGVSIPHNAANDVFLFYFFRQKGLTVAYEPRAVVLFTFPSTLQDLLKQNKRHLKTNHRLYFPKELIKTHDTRTKRKIFPVLLKHVVEQPITGTCFILLFFYASLLAKRYNRQATWEYLASTKSQA